VSDRMPDDTEQRRGQTSQIAQGYRTAHEILSGAMGLGLLAGAGAWLDHRYGWSPVLTIIGSCIGTAYAGLTLRQILRRLDQESARKKNQRSKNENI
jgi:F0F1-type ATP synthase assembly protein I